MRIPGARGRARAAGAFLLAGMLSGPVAGFAAPVSGVALSGATLFGAATSGAGMPASPESEDPAAGSATVWDSASLDLDFAHGVAPLLMRAGCSAAECHGGATGRGGFRLSLFGTDPDLDWRAITVERRGRRLDPADPAHSLLLRKPTRDLPHGGGRRLRVGDAAHSALLRWIAAGTPFVGPRGALELRSLEVHRQGERLHASADFAGPDGAPFRVDVSDRCLFRSTDERVVAVEADGTVRDGGPGSAWLLARYRSLTARLEVVRPYKDDIAFEEGLETGAVGVPSNTVVGVPSNTAVGVPGGTAVGVPSNTAVGVPGGTMARDPLPAQRWREALRRRGVAPAPTASGVELRRRLHLVLIGRPPTPAEQDAWDALDPGLRWTRTVDRLLGCEEWTEEWTRRVGDWLEIPRAEQDLPHQRERHRALRGRLHEVVSADRLPDWWQEALADPPTHPLLARFPDPRDRAEFCGRAVLGLQLGCARCHDHPRDRWTQSQHLAFSAFFADTGAEDEGRVGRLFHPRTGEAVAPRRLPLGSSPEGEAAPDLPALLRGDARRAVARHQVNRAFAEVMGRGIVTPVGDHRPGNPAVHEPLLEALTDAVLAADLSLRATVRAVVDGPWFTRTSDPAATGTTDPHFARRVALHAAYEARALDGFALRRAIAAVLDGPESAEQPPGSPLALALHLWNGSLLGALEEPGNQVQAIVDFVPGAEARLEALYRLILARSPRATEREAFTESLREDAGVRALAEALLCSREFGSRR